MTTLSRFTALAASWALLCSCSWFSKSEFVPANDVNVSVMGRVEHTPEGGLRLGYPGVTLRVVFEGTSLAVRAVSSNEYGRFLLRAYIAEAVERLGDRRVHSFASGQYLGDACNQHPTHAQNLAMLRELAPILSQTLGW